MPISFDAHDVRADGGVRYIEIHRERVILRRAVRGMQMAINVRICDFLGIALRGLDEGQTLVLVHRDSSLSIPLCVSSDANEIEMAWRTWSEIFALPQLPQAHTCEPAPRRRRHNPIRARRPRFLMRRRPGDLLGPAASWRGEREIIARN